MTYNLNPFLKAMNKAHFGNLHAFFAAAATTKQVIARTEYSPAATSILFFFSWDEDLVEVVIVKNMMSRCSMTEG